MIKVAVGIIIRNQDEILLCQRKPDLAYPLKWEFPGGKLKHNETAIDALRRELLEELNITAEIELLFHRRQYEYPDSGVFDVHYYLVKSFTGKIKNHTFESLCWVPAWQLPQMDILEGNSEVVSMLMKKLLTNEPVKN
jgi:8-oxo-dGTP diphosphatase